MGATRICCKGYRGKRGINSWRHIINTIIWLEPGRRDEKGRTRTPKGDVEAELR